MALISIGSTDLPDPVEYSVTLQDLDSENTKRTETGLLSRDRVRAGVYKIQATWKVKKTDLMTITTALAPAKMSVTFFDPTSSENVTKDMYSGDRSGNLIFMAKNPDDSLWEFSTALIEY
jgi:hypothetical protein